MRKLLLLFIVFPMISITCFRQQTINASITNAGIQRDYILYIPANYSGSTPVPLLFNFHGYTSNASDQMWYGDFRNIADTAGFIIVHPEGTVDNNGSTHFNVGWGASSVDDVAFTSALMDTLIAAYNIDEDRVYSTGMSNGGFMSFKLACELSSRIAAIGSVTGSIVPFTLNSCNAVHPTPILQIHGTADGTVPYLGGAGWTEPISSLVNYWVNSNNCDATAITEMMPDINVGDGSTVEKFSYLNGNNCSEVVHFKIQNGDHTWPGTIFNTAGTNYDINASIEVWNFVSRFDINGLINCASIHVDENETSPSINVHPNPTNNNITVNGIDESTKYTLVSLLGQELMSGTLSVQSSQLDLSNLPADIYLLRIENHVFEIMKVD